MSHQDEQSGENQCKERAQELLDTEGSSQDKPHEMRFGLHLQEVRESRHMVTWKRIISGSGKSKCKGTG